MTFEEYQTQLRTVLEAPEKAPEVFLALQEDYTQLLGKQAELEQTNTAQAEQMAILQRVANKAFLTQPVGTTPTGDEGGDPKPYGCSDLLKEVYNVSEPSE